MVFLQENGLGKEGYGIIEPVSVKKRTKGLRLGIDPNIPPTKREYMNSTFTPPIYISKQWGHVVEDTPSLVHT